MAQIGDVFGEESIIWRARQVVDKQGVLVGKTHDQEQIQFPCVVGKNRRGNEQVGGGGLQTSGEYPQQ